LYWNPVWIFVNKMTWVPLNLDNSVNAIDINDVSSIAATVWVYLDDETNIITPISNKLLKVSPNTSCSRLLELWKKNSWQYKILDATNDIERETYCDMWNGNGGWTTVWQGDKHNTRLSSSYFQENIFIQLDSFSCSNLNISVNFVAISLFTVNRIFVLAIILNQKNNTYFQVKT
jgi:hypothetical protein